MKMIDSNTHDICEDWGWYVDTDNNSFIKQTAIKSIKYYILNKIQEEQHSDEDISNNFYDIENQSGNFNNTENDIETTFYNISSTTIMTSIIVYVIFFLI